MRLRTKIISSLALLFTVLVVLDIAVQHEVVMPSFAELERDGARTSMKRIEYALRTAQDGLRLTAEDWGNWADVYRFAEHQSADFVATNITAVALKQLQINALLIVDLHGTVLVAAARDLDSGAELPLDLAAGHALPLDFPWRRNLGGAPTQGLLQTNLGVMMLAAAPILNGSGGGRSLGMVIMGKLLTAQQLKRIGDQAQARLSRADADLNQIVETATSTDVYRSFPDIFGRPVMSLRVETPRAITARGRGAVTYASVYLVMAAATALIVLVMVLNRIVLAPLARVTRHAVTIGDATDLSMPLGLPGDDEVAVLSREFDRMVERLATSRRQWVDQSFQSGFAELAKGVVHNLGNAMTPLAVRVAQLTQNLERAPVDDLQRAVAELSDGRPDARRRADLEEFVRMGCVELCRVVLAARDDMSVVQRQAAIVQAALTELMRTTRRDYVLESVRLPELMAQTLEIVPDACRQRLLVEADDSLNRIGAVRLARTVLRLVLQNLIINASDAIRDAGRERGKFRVAAEIVNDDGAEALHLRCEDDGVGIAQDHLERVFDQGFSTKSHETNHGIGLHWCANAIGALGGRIWATSDGPGCGAVLHLLMPLPAAVPSKIMKVA